MRRIPLFFLVFFLTFSLLTASQNDTAIKGKIEVNPTLWESKIYLTQINSFESMYAVSKDLIIAETEIDSTGAFSFSTLFFPEEELLYRIHIVKKNDPPASLSIGGVDENHLFVIASRSQGVSLESFSKDYPFSKIQVTGSMSSIDFQRINSTASYKDSTIINGEIVKPEFIATTIDERLRTMADSLSSPITATYALYRTNYEKHALTNPEYFIKHVSKWNTRTSKYLHDFEKQLNLPAKESISISWILAIGLGILFFAFGVLFSKWYSKPEKQTSQKLQQLSVQERKVFHLMQLGKSNKDISEELSIGISTVKSHVSNIYGKLCISSRKEAMNIKS